MNLRKIFAVTALAIGAGIAVAPTVGADQAPAPWCEAAGTAAYQTLTIVRDPATGDIDIDAVPVPACEGIEIGVAIYPTGYATWAERVAAGETQHLALGTYWQADGRIGLTDLPCFAMAQVDVFNGRPLDTVTPGSSLYNAGSIGGINRLLTAWDVTADCAPVAPPTTVAAPPTSVVAPPTPIPPALDTVPPCADGPCGAMPDVDEPTTTTVDEPTNVDVPPTSTVLRGPLPKTGSNDSGVLLLLGVLAIAVGLEVCAYAEDLRP